MHYMSTKFGVDSSRHFPFRSWTDRHRDKVTDAIGHPTCNSAAASIGNSNTDDDDD